MAGNGARLAEVAELEFRLLGSPTIVDYRLLFNLVLSRYFGKPVLAVYYR